MHHDDFLVLSAHVQDMLDGARIPGRFAISSELQKDGMPGQRVRHLGRQQPPLNTVPESGGPTTRGTAHKTNTYENKNHRGQKSER